MHFFLIGATGRTGQLVLKESLAQGHTVTALVRDTSKLEPQEGLTLAKGTSMSARDLSAAFDDSPSRIDAVIVTLNIKRESGSPWAKPISPPDLMEKSIGNAARAMKEHGVRKLIVMSAFGVGDSLAQAPWYLRAMIQHSNMGPQFEDHEAAFRVVRDDASIDWVFLRPLRLTDGDKKAVKSHGDLGRKVSGLASISVASVAAALVDAAAGDQFKRTPVITN